jgi:hypothetical protein
MKRNINGVEYYPKTAKEKDKFYPVVFFCGAKIGGQTFYINEPQKTRGKALTISTNYIKNL